MHGVILIENAVTEDISISKSEGNKVMFETVLQTFNEENNNKRVYQLKDAEQAISEIIPRLSEGNFGGELDHPIPTSDEVSTWIRHTTYKYSQACYKINSLFFRDNKLYGECETLRTPNGFILANLLTDKVRVGFSARAFSDQVEMRNGVEYVIPPITYIAFDAVSNPSHKEAKVIKVSNIEQHIPKKCPDGVCRLTEHIERKRRSPLFTFFKSGKILL